MNIIAEHRLNRLIQNIHLLDDNIVLTPYEFPFENHSAWIEAFAQILSKYANFRVREIETNADITLVSLNVDDTVFILNISDTVESIWLSSTIRDKELVNRVFSQLDSIFCQA